MPIADQVTLVDNITLAMHTVLQRLARRSALRSCCTTCSSTPSTRSPPSSAVARLHAGNWRAAPKGPAVSTGDGPVLGGASVHRQLSERFIEACSGGDLEGLLALLDPAVQGTGDVVSGVLVGATHIVLGDLALPGAAAAPTLVHLPVGGRVGIVALRDRGPGPRRLKVDNGLVVHRDALAGLALGGGQHGARAALSGQGGDGPRAAVAGWARSGGTWPRRVRRQPASF